MENTLINIDFANSPDFGKCFDLFRADFSGELHWGKIYLHLFGRYYSTYKLNFSFNPEVLMNGIIAKYSVKNESMIRIEKSAEEDIHLVSPDDFETMMIIKEHLCVVIKKDNIEILYGPDILSGKRNELVDYLNSFSEEKPLGRRFYMVQNCGYQFDLMDFEISPLELDVKTHYNDDFQEVQTIIRDSLEKKKRNGLVLLHGMHGTGKTYYIRHLISKIDRKFIYFPLNMIEELNSPHFLPFITRHPGAVLILEDCETLLMHREDNRGNASALSNLLNLGDGLLGEALSLNVICTFNSGIRKIDDAILRKGRLIARYEFGKLEVQKAVSLARKLGKEIEISDPVTISEIYNARERDFVKPDVRSIGFRVA